MSGITRQRYDDLQAAARAAIEARALAPQQITNAVVEAFASAHGITRPTARKHLVHAANQMRGYEGPSPEWGGPRKEPAPSIARRAYALQQATAKARALAALDGSALAMSIAAARAATKDLEQEAQRRHLEQTRRASDAAEAEE